MALDQWADRFEQSEALNDTFGSLAGSSTLCVSWHLVFMVLTTGIVLGGVQKGVERASRILMPTLFAFMAVLLIYGTTLDGFGRAFDFVFGLHADQLTAGGVLEALGHAFFSLSLGMGAMLTYGSYLSKDTDVAGTSIAISLLDTVVALMACLVLFPITFTYDMEAAKGPSLVFTNMPVAFSQLPGGTFLSTLFFLLLSFAALTSAISLLEVVSSYFIDNKKWSRSRAVLSTAAFIALLGIPSALSFNTTTFGADMENGILGKSFFDAVDYITSSWLLPLGGMGIALFAAWGIGDKARRTAIEHGSSLGKMSKVYLGWLQLLRFVVPIAIALVMANVLGLFK